MSQPTDYTLVLHFEYPGTVWTLNDNDYEQLQWLCDDPKPSQADLDAKWPAVQTKIANRKQLKIEALAKLGLTADEIDALFG